MADSTSIIVIDSTGDSTGIVQITDIEATVANSLVADFAASMGPIAAKCDKLAGQTNRIRDEISAMTPSGTSLFDEFLKKAMNAAYESSAWAMAADASAQIEDMLGRCEYFKDAADKAAKYADPSKFLKSLGNAAAEKAKQAIDVIKDQFAGSGDTFDELGIGEKLAEIAETGRAVYDKVSEKLEDAAEAISPIIEYGKAAVNAAQSELAAAAKELGKLDKLINCLAGIGGPDYAPAIDEMIEQLDCYYDKLGVFSDAALPNFGEFDFESYLDGIGSISGDPAAINNIKKAVNLYSKSKANAQGAVEKASDLGIKTPSALKPGKQANTTKKKTEYAESASKTSYTVPAIPGKTEEKTVTIPTPEPVVAPPISEGVPPVPEKKVPYTIYVKSQEVIFPPPSVNDEQEKYEKYDPGHAQFPSYLSSAYAGISKIKIVEPTTPPDITLKLSITHHFWDSKVEDPLFGDKSYLLGINVAVNYFLINNTSGNFVTKANFHLVWNDTWTPEEQVPFQKEQASGLFFKAWNEAYAGITFSAEDIQHTLS